MKELESGNVLGFSCVVFWESKTRFLRINEEEGER